MGHVCSGLQLLFACQDLGEGAEVQGFDIPVSQTMHAECLRADAFAGKGGALLFLLARGGSKVLKHLGLLQQKLEAPLPSLTLRRRTHTSCMTTAGCPLRLALNTLMADEA